MQAAEHGGRWTAAVGHTQLKDSAVGSTVVRQSGVPESASQLYQDRRQGDDEGGDDSQVESFPSFNFWDFQL